MSDETLADSSSHDHAISDKSRDDEPDIKKPKLEEPVSLSTKQNAKLENRLSSIFCCSVCLDLPNSAVYQCTNGHLMCSGCLNHLLADARLRDDTASCPKCRVDIGRAQVSRNLAVEHAVCELPARCQHCAELMPRATLHHHEHNQCQQRPVSCDYMLLGCRWTGALSSLADHRASCQLPQRPAHALLSAITAVETRHQQHARLSEHIVRLLSCDKLEYNDVQLRPYRSDEFTPRLFYESSRFSALDCQWSIKMHVNDSQRDPSHTCDRRLSYQLILKSKWPTVQQSSALVHFMALAAPHTAGGAATGGDTVVAPAVYSHRYGGGGGGGGSEATGQMSPPCALPVSSACEANRLLAAKNINIRLFMFQSIK